jgi:aminoglycoside phosphotransferase (APT) family kinase protein
VSGAAEIAAALERVVRARIPGATGVEHLRRLSGGASQETWSFDATTAGAPEPLILRRRPGGLTGPTGSGMGIALETEAEILGLAAAGGVPVAGVRAVLAPEDALGSGYLMERLAGETIARRILRDAAFAPVRPRLARQCGEILAKIHAIPCDALPKLAFAPAPVQLDQYRALYDAYDQPHPVFELALRWLSERAQDPPRASFVHGDFRNGNLMFDRAGVRGVLDWELAHTGDPMEDLGWICVPSWRFGEIDHPVGGFGSREELFAGYEAAGGGAVDPERVRTWEVLGTLKWGIMCMTMYSIFASGADRSVERAAIGRRSSETEIDLLALLEA